MSTSRQSTKSASRRSPSGNTKLPELKNLSLAQTEVFDTVAQVIKNFSESEVMEFCDTFNWEKSRLQEKLEERLAGVKGYVSHLPENEVWNTVGEKKKKPEREEVPVFSRRGRGGGGDRGGRGRGGGGRGEDRRDASRSTDDAAEPEALTNAHIKDEVSKEAPSTRGEFTHRGGGRGGRGGGGRGGRGRADRHDDKERRDDRPPRERKEKFPNEELKVASAPSASAFQGKPSFASLFLPKEVPVPQASLDVPNLSAEKKSEGQSTPRIKKTRDRELRRDKKESLEPSESLEVNPNVLKTVLATTAPEETVKPPPVEVHEPPAPSPKPAEVYAASHVQHAGHQGIPQHGGLPRSSSSEIVDVLFSSSHGVLLPDSATQTNSLAVRFGNFGRTPPTSPIKEAAHAVRPHQQSLAPEPSFDNEQHRLAQHSLLGHNASSQGNTAPPLPLLQGGRAQGSSEEGPAGPLLLAQKNKDDTAQIQDNVVDQHQTHPYYNQQGPLPDQSFRYPEAYDPGLSPQLPFEYYDTPQPFYNQYWVDPANPRKSQGQQGNRPRGMTGGNYRQHPRSTPKGSKGPADLPLPAAESSTLSAQGPPPLGYAFTSQQAVQGSQSIPPPQTQGGVQGYGQSHLPTHPGQQSYKADKLYKQTHINPHTLQHPQHVSGASYKHPQAAQAYPLAYGGFMPPHYPYVPQSYYPQGQYPPSFQGTGRAPYYQTPYYPEQYAPEYASYGNETMEEQRPQSYDKGQSAASENTLSVAKAGTRVQGKAQTAGGHQGSQGPPVQYQAQQYHQTQQGIFQGYPQQQHQTNLQFNQPWSANTQ